jgi:hypothetical protein
VKVALCVTCTDFVTPLRTWQTDRSWRWCQCRETAVRWRDGARGLLEVTSLHGPASVRVLGLSNLFLQQAVTKPQVRDGLSFPQWRELHDTSAQAVEPHYLFHVDKRACWALVVRVGESSDVTFIGYGDAVVDSSPAGSSG